MKFTFTLVLLLFIFEGHAEIYKWVDEHGNAHFTQNINDVPKDIEVKEAKVKVSHAIKNTNPVKSTIKKNQTLLLTFQYQLISSNLQIMLQHGRLIIEK